VVHYVQQPYDLGSMGVYARHPVVPERGNPGHNQPCIVNPAPPSATLFCLTVSQAQDIPTYSSTLGRSSATNGNRDATRGNTGVMVKDARGMAGLCRRNEVRFYL
jgi:hypothetical protein